MKNVPFFENISNVRCLQCCVKMVIKHFLPEADLWENDAEIDRRTCWTRGSWITPAAVFLHQLGLDISLYCSDKWFDYAEFANVGRLYLEEGWSKERIDAEQAAGALDSLDCVQSATKEMVRLGLWKREYLENKTLAVMLKDSKSLAIGKTKYEKLAGHLGKTPHYVLVLQKEAPSQWVIHDPGLEGKPYRKVSWRAGGESVLEEIILVRGLKSD